MRFLIDEYTGPSVARWLESLNHEVFSVYDDERGMSDEAIIKKAYSESWILITNDMDFGEYVYRKRWPHRGLILLRLEDERPSIKIDTLRRLLENYSNRSADNFVVMNEKRVRFGRASKAPA